ncbi:MAG: cysteine hydrolase [Hungatella sp.]|nr:cysteine hydrolase [Hungatella sp.]
MKKLLIVVDMQNDFIDGSLGTKEAEAVVPAVKEKIKAYEEAGDEVVFTMDTHFEDYLDTQEGRNLPVKHCIKDSHGWMLHESLKDFSGKRFEKRAFGSVECGQYAAGGNYESVELVGLCTDICVISNAMLIKSMSPELTVIVDGRCCAGVTPQSHENALKAMKMCQIMAGPNKEA